jgi:quercetin dioxygenase-like cupin family protein
MSVNMQSLPLAGGNETYQFAGTLMTVLVDGTETDGRFALLLARVPPGNATPPHFHDGDSETLVVLDGAVTADTPGRSDVLYAGDASVLAPGQVHRLSNAGQTEASYLLLCEPAGFEQFVRQAGTQVDANATARHMDENDVRLLVESAPLYGVRLTDEAKLTRPEGGSALATPRVTFDALGATVEILAEFGDDDDAVVLLRATSRRPTRGLFGQRGGADSASIDFFAATEGDPGNQHGKLASSAQPALLAVTNRGVVRLMRRGDLPAPNVGGGPLQQVLAVLHALHDAGSRGASDDDLPVRAERQGLPIH